MILFACSGPGAGATIARSIEIGYTHAAVGGALLVVSLVLFALGPRRWLFPSILIALVALHPAWTISAMHGDCGFLKRGAACVFTIIGILVVVAQGVFVLTQRGESYHHGVADEELL